MTKMTLLVGMLVACASPLFAKDYLTICSGQSNMAGIAPVAQMPEELKAVPANIVYFKNSDLTKLLEPLTTFADGPKFGPTASFAHALAEAGKWHLPNVNEIQSLCDYGYFDPVITNDKGDAKWTPDGVGTTCSISSVQSGWYWTSITTVSPDRTWAMILGTVTIHFDPSMTDHVWPVRGGK